MPFWQKVSGTWKNTVPYTRVSGVWKACTGYLNVSGVWKIITEIYNPPSGPVSAYNFGAPAQVILNSSVPVTWTYSVVGGGSPGGSVNQASGYVGTQIIFTQTQGAPGTLRSNTWNVSAAASGLPSGAWTVQCDAEA